ncbi:MAG: TetR/AcrR family transcriptional regulator, partial [Xanthomonadales bacterium]|nr:TetR/AcrR family transcriptional regulator [Xanthomonadales bacterium]
MSSANRDCIVTSALRLFARRGYTRTSIGDIADEAGMLKGNIAYYFKTKPEILAGVIDERRRRIMARLNADAGESAPDAIKRLIVLVESSADEMARTGCPVGSLAGELGKHDEALRARAAGLLVHIQTWLEQQFSRIQTPPAAQASAEHLLTLMQGSAVLAHAHGDAHIVRKQMAHARQWLDEVVQGP